MFSQAKVCGYIYSVDIIYILFKTKIKTNQSVFFSESFILKV